MDTIDPMVMPGPPAGERQAPPRRRRYRWLIPLVLAALLLVAASTVTLPYYAVAPGSAREVNDLIRVPKERAFPPEGKMYLATVSLRRARPLEVLQGWLDADVDVVPEKRVLGSTPQDQFRHQNRELMQDSKDVAAVVALRHLGFAVPEGGRGGLVLTVEKGSPAEGRLTPGDVVTAVDGRPTTLSTQVVNAIRAHRPGHVVRLDVQGRSGPARSEQVTLAARPGQEAGFLGVSLQTKDHTFDYPFEVRIESGLIGGPSAGLAFTLGVLDNLTPGELTGGKQVAATGTIDTDGTVGNVGGVAQKTAAVRAAGAEYFLVPAGEYQEAVSHAGGDLKVLKVSNLGEAIGALAGLGGDVSALGPPGGATRG